VAGVALGDMDRHFAWQAWHLVTSMRTLLGRRGTYGTGLALVARLGPVDAWQAWTFALHGRRGAWRHGPSLCVAGLALGDIDVHFAWQVLHLVPPTCTLRGKRGTDGPRTGSVGALGS